MATPKSQRIAILIIAVVMVVGTFGSFAALILGAKNESADTERAQQASAVYQSEVEAQNKELTEKYYPVLSQYKELPGKFDRDSVKELTTEDLVVGTGSEIKDGKDYVAYYIGWNIDGKVFDQSIEGETLKTPIDPSMGLIEGWDEGVKGMKIGGVRLLTIPSDKAYGEKGGGDDIPSNTPIKFVVMAIEKPKQIEVPAILNSPSGAYK